MRKILQRMQRMKKVTPKPKPKAMPTTKPTLQSRLGAVKKASKPSPLQRRLTAVGRTRRPVARPKPRPKPKPRAPVKQAKAPGKFVVGPAPSPLAGRLSAMKKVTKLSPLVDRLAAMKKVAKPKPRVRRKPKIRKAVTRRRRVY